MSRKTFNISLPESIGAFVRLRVESKGYASVSEYIRELIREDRHCAVGARDIAADFDAARSQRFDSQRDPRTGRWR